MGSATEVTSSGLGQLSLGGQVAGKGTGNYLGRAGSPLGWVFCVLVRSGLILGQAQGDG